MIARTRSDFPANAEGALVGAQRVDLLRMSPQVVPKGDLLGERSIPLRTDIEMVPGEAGRMRAIDRLERLPTGDAAVSLVRVAKRGESIDNLGKPVRLDDDDQIDDRFRGHPGNRRAPHVLETQEEPFEHRLDLIGDPAKVLRPALPILVNQRDLHRAWECSGSPVRRVQAGLPRVGW